MNKCDDVLTEVHNIKPSVLLLQETKLPQISTQKARSFHPAHLNNFAFKPSTGAAGGILNAVSNTTSQSTTPCSTTLPFPR
jgi:exonuclease III